MKWNRSGFFLTGTGTGQKFPTGPDRPVERHKYIVALYRKDIE